MAQPIELHYWPTPNGHKITIALEEMGLPYEIKPINIGQGEQFKPAFLAISPNNRMPAMVDPDGPGGRVISVFESGAILQYLGRKSGKFYGADEHARSDVEQWLYWQMANLGPNAGQAGHFRNYAPMIVADQRQLAYGANRYTNEVHRLYGVLNARLKDREHLCGDYSVADMATYPWTVLWKGQGVILDEFPAVRAWFQRMRVRPAVVKAYALTETFRRGPGLDTPGDQAARARKVLFGQRAR
jgi:glutathione S-transferase/GST-like protein